MIDMSTFPISFLQFSFYYKQLICFFHKTKLHIQSNNKATIFLKKVYLCYRQIYSKNLFLSFPLSLSLSLSHHVAFLISDINLHFFLKPIKLGLVLLHVFDMVYSQKRRTASSQCIQAGQCEFVKICKVNVARRSILLKVDRPSGGPELRRRTCLVLIEYVGSRESRSAITFEIRKNLIAMKITTYVLHASQLRDIINKRCNRIALYSLRKKSLSLSHFSSLFFLSCPLPHPFSVSLSLSHSRSLGITHDLAMNQRSEFRLGPRWLTSTRPKVRILAPTKAAQMQSLG